MSEGPEEFVYDEDTGEWVSASAATAGVTIPGPGTWYVKVKGAAVGNPLAARIYDMPCLFSDIQDVSPNVTRFLVLCRRRSAASRRAVLECPVQTSDRLAVRCKDGSRLGRAFLLLPRETGEVARRHRRRDGGGAGRSAAEADAPSTPSGSPSPASG